MHNPAKSLCKRYKRRMLENQLSDIHCIDCNTPEHTVSGGGGDDGGSSLSRNTIFTSAPGHRPPPHDEDSNYKSELIGIKNFYPCTQYSYVKYGSPIKETRFRNLVPKIGTRTAAECELAECRWPAAVGAKGCFAMKGTYSSYCKDGSYC